VEVDEDVAEGDEDGRRGRAEDVVREAVDIVRVRETKLSLIWLYVSPRGSVGIRRSPEGQ
jgi:hypothetical protein